CLAAGFPVLLHDAANEPLETAAGRIRAGLEILQSKGRLSSAEEAFARLQTVPDLVHMRGADWIIEAVCESEEVKENVLVGLGRLWRPEAVLASNTSSISITRLGAASGRPDQFIGMHFFNPPPVMALVEIVRGLQTSEETFRAAVALAERL